MSYNPNFRGNAATASRQLRTGYTNGTMSTINKAVAVYGNSLGNILPVDVSSETTVTSMVGLSAESIPSAASGLVASAGRLENVTLGFNPGDAIYVGKNAALTNIKPNVGTDGFQVGDFVIFVGVVVKNEFNNSQLDIQLMISIVGQL